MDTKDSTRGQRNMVNAKRKRKEEKTRKFVVIAYIFLPSCLFFRASLVLWLVISGMFFQVCVISVKRRRKIKTRMMNRFLSI